jgi:4-hydroxy-3-methylbut-2-enyl diphosphate reductase
VKIILANPRGFCAGVNMAIDSLERALELFGAPLYVYHEIVHNRHVVERFRRRGVVFVDDVDTIPPDAKLAYLTQTTLSVDDANVIIDALKRRYPDIVGPSRDDICYATQNRQEAVKDLLDESDVVIVLGSRNSSNSRRLAEIAHSCGKPAHLIDHAGEIDDAWFAGAECVLITAGASAPEEVVQECVDYLNRRFAATVESRTVREEHVSFPLPHELRVLAS